MPQSPKAPEQLRQIQAWLTASVLTGKDQDGLSSRYLTASKTMTSNDRFEVYVTDYHYRCLDSLRDDFVGLEKILGKAEFEKLIDRYLDRYPSRSFTLYLLGQDLLKFLTDEYHAPNRDLVLQDAAYEWAYMWAYLAPVQPVFDPAALDDAIKANLANLPLRLSESATLLKLDYDVRSKRNKNASDVLPLYLVVYRKNYVLDEKLVDPIFFAILTAFQEGASLSGALEGVLQNSSEADAEKLLLHARAWFQVAVGEQWLVRG